MERISSVDGTSRALADLILRQGEGHKNPAKSSLLLHHTTTTHSFVAPRPDTHTSEHPSNTANKLIYKVNIILHGDNIPQSGDEKRGGYGSTATRLDLIFFD
jgi:hypothetical protein